MAMMLGYGVVAGSVIAKVPQIVAIVRHRRLSAAAFELEAAGLTIALAYCLVQQLPFSAYGELVFLLLQSLLCVALIYHYSPALGAFTLVKAALYCALAPSLLAGRLHARLLEALYTVFFAARLAHIWRSTNTDRLSLVTSFFSCAGCGVRTFTSLQEHAPLGMVVGSVLGVLTNGVVCAQTLAYGSTSEEHLPDDDKSWKVE